VTEIEIICDTRKHSLFCVCKTSWYRSISQ